MPLNEFSRLSSLIGDNCVEKLKQKTVLIVGIGGVGSYVLESLVRSGVGTIIVVDYDTVDITNINRQIIALHSTIGMKKVDVAQNRVKDINPNCNLIKYDVFFDDEHVNMIFDHSIDFVIDACDSVLSKKLLIRECIKRKIDFISCMGTANRLDPSLLEIIELNKTLNDPLARIMRKFAKEEKIDKKIMVLSSKEVPIKKGNTLGSNSYVPSSAGLLIGSYVINKLIK